MTVFATVDSLTAGLLSRAVRAWQRVNPLAPAPRVRKARPRMRRNLCPYCSKFVAYSSSTHLTSKHFCQGVITQRQIDLRPPGPTLDGAGAERRPTAGSDALGRVQPGPSAGPEAA